MMKTLAILLSSAAALAVACGSDSTPKKVDAKVFMDSPGSGSGSGAMLTVKNYLNWCTVSVDGGAFSTSAAQMVPITSAGAKALVAKPASSTFEVGGNMWHHTDGDTGTGETGTVSGTGTAATSTAMVTVATTTSKCVWVCCPFSNGTGCDTVAEQCP